MAGRWVLSVVFKEEGAGGAATSSRGDKGLLVWEHTLAGCWSCENRGSEEVCVDTQGLAALPETKPKETCSGRAQLKMIYCWEGTACAALLGEVTQNWLVFELGVPLPVLEEFNLSKSDNQGLRCGMGAGVAGAQPVRHLLSRCSLVGSAPEVMCVPCAKGQRVHAMVVLQAIKITLNMSRRTLWAHCVSDHWEKCLAPVPLTWVETFGELSADFALAWPRRLVMFASFRDRFSCHSLAWDTCFLQDLWKGWAFP